MQGGSASGDEDNTITGRVTAGDVDSASLTYTVVTQAGHGAVTLNQDGSFSYTPQGDYSGSDSFTFKVNDGSLDSNVASVNLTINAVNDAPVAEDGSARGDEDTTITGTVVASDVDNTSLTYTVVAQAGHGTVTLNQDGSFSYTPTGDYFGTDSFTFRVSDGSLDSNLATIDLTINAVNDAPVAQDGSASGNGVIAGVLVATDVDGPSLNYVRVAQAQHGSVTIGADGSYVYIPDAGFSGSDSFTYKANDGTRDSNIATVSITVNVLAPPENQVPVNTLPGTLAIEANTSTAIAGLAISDPDAGAGIMTTTLSVAHGTLTVASAGGAAVTGSGTTAVTLTGTLAAINTTLGAGNVVYRGAQDVFGSDTLTVVTNDGGNGGSSGPLIDVDQVAMHLNTHLTGTPSDDSFAALPGNERIDAGGGNDTVSFGFKLTEATFTWSGNQLTVDGPTSHTLLTGVETYVFTDGTVQQNDGDALVDDLLYFAQNHDLWNAQADANAHYHTIGWQEGRDPNAFFDTSLYQSLYPDVNGLDPLAQFDQDGWKAGRVPSFDFDPAAYLAANPDVKAAGVDPLAHFLEFGLSEGRQASRVTSLLAADGFDFVYYLAHNPDVAAAHVDPLAHFATTGWKEGRNPNALFDVNGYLATYTDVKAAGVNPFDHYNQFGWQEGRDPSAGFDTTDYLAAYPDVAAAHVNPLLHFLQFGIHEGRSPFADGVLG